MIWSLDAVADSLYVKIAREPIASQAEMPDGTVVDLSSDGLVVGVDVVRVSAGWDPDAVVREFELSSEIQASLRMLATSLGQPPVRPAERPVAVEPAFAGDYAPAVG